MYDHALLRCELVKYHVPTKDQPISLLHIGRDQPERAMAAVRLLQSAFESFRRLISALRHRPHAMQVVGNAQ